MEPYAPEGPFERNKIVRVGFRSKWVTMLVLQARMNNFRAPVGAVLRLSFRRYVRQNDGDDSSSVARARAQDQADKQRRVEEQLGSENLEAPLRILLINNELDG